MEVQETGSVRLAHQVEQGQKYLLSRMTLVTLNRAIQEDKEKFNCKEEVIRDWEVERSRNSAECMSESLVSLVSPLAQPYGSKRIWLLAAHCKAVTQCI